MTWDDFWTRQLVHSCTLTAASAASAVDADYQMVPMAGPATTGVPCRYAMRQDEDIIDSEEAGALKVDAYLYLAASTPVAERARVSTIADAVGGVVDPGPFWVRRVLRRYGGDATVAYTQCFLERFR